MKIILNILGFFLAIVLVPLLSWLIIHILALLGIFVAFAYPVYWLIIPRYSFCFSCRIQKNKGYCDVCKSTIDSTGKNYSPKNFRSALINSVVILVISVFSAGVVFIESLILTRFGFIPASKTASFVVPSKGQYKLGEIFSMRVDVGNLKTSINAVQADIEFDADKIEVVDVTTRESFASIFINKEINNSYGWLRITGGIPNPGYVGDDTLFSTVYFRGTKPGVASVRFLPSSMVLANDGKGTNILRDYPTTSYLILPDRISYEEELLQIKQITSQETTEEENQTEDGGQLKFYEQGRVLGASIEPLQYEEELIDNTLDIWQQINQFILDFWINIFSLRWLGY